MTMRPHRLQSENGLVQKAIARLLLVIFLIIPFSAAEAEDVLNLLIWEGYAPRVQVEKFESYINRKYNQKVTLDIKYLSDPNDFYNAVRSKKADIISPTHNLLKDSKFDLINKNLILPIDLSNIPNYKELFPNLQHADYIVKNTAVYGVPFAYGPYGLAYNAKLIKKPDTWNALWNPEYANKYTISADYYEVNIYITALALGYDREMLVNADKLNNPVLKRKLKSLIKNAHSLWTGVDKVEDLTGLLLAAVWGFSLPELNKRGEVWDWAAPREGTIGWVDNYVICYSLKDKPFLRKVAEEWLNFVISPDFQIDVVVHGLGSDPVNMSIKNRLTPAEVLKHHLDEDDYFQKKYMLWPTLTRKRDRNLLKRLWNDALK